MYDVIGISHALIDLCADVDEAFLEKFKLDIGSMQLVDDKGFKEIHDELDKKNIKVEFGGSVSNTIDGLHLLGCKVAEFAKVGNDEYGNMIMNEKDKKKIGNFITRHDSPTGTVLALITPEGERTFVVCLGAAAHLGEEDVPKKDIQNTKIIHFTGYEFESPVVKGAVEKAIKIAKENKILVSFDLADSGLVQRNFAELKTFVENNVDILFANEEEAEEFTGMTPEKAVNKIAEIVDYAVVKMGENGSIIKISNENNTYNIKANKVNTKDTTGAGDMYSACILYGIVKGLNLDKAGKIASEAASKVVEKKGARLTEADLSKYRY